MLKPQISAGFLWLYLFTAIPLENCFGIKLIGGDSEQGGQHNQFFIRNIAQPGFNLSQRGAADVQTFQLAARGKLLLGQSQFPAHFADLRADNIRWIFFSGHV